MNRTLAIALFAAGLAVATAGTARATVALTGFSGGTLFTSAFDQVWGWYFDTSAPIDVRALGVGDSGGDGLVDAHDVGIFAVSDQSLLVSATVPSGSGATLLDGFRYEAVSPFHLNAGSYVILMTMPAETLDSQFAENTSETTSSPVTFVGSAFDQGSSLAFPTNGVGQSTGNFGPNFEFDSRGPLPEPATWSIVLVGLGGVGAALRSRRRVLTA